MKVHEKALLIINTKEKLDQLNKALKWFVDNTTWQNDLSIKLPPAVESSIRTAFTGVDCSDNATLFTEAVRQSLNKEVGKTRAKLQELGVMSAQGEWL